MQAEKTYQGSSDELLVLYKLGVKLEYWQSNNQTWQDRNWPKEPPAPSVRYRVKPKETANENI